jgi:hypothetical protein
MDQRTITGSMAYWHACMILMMVDLQGRERNDEDVQICAKEVIRLGREAGDKIEYMMWVSTISANTFTILLLRGDEADTIANDGRFICPTRPSSPLGRARPI